MYLKFFAKALLVIFLTVLTQIGGIIFIIIEICFRKKSHHNRLKRVGFAFSAYLITTFVIVPNIAPIFGRVKIEDNTSIKAHTIFTKICNRNYITPAMNKALQQIAAQFQSTHPTVQLVYLDANFPFLEGFPLLPHLSHNDGKKIDISFVYTDQKGELSNAKPSIFGYGSFVYPEDNEYNQTHSCKKKGYWQYDMTKYTTFGISNKKLKFSEKATKDLLLAIIKQPEIRKVFIEPHIKKRLSLNQKKIRFHGCQAVRHDDHIHIQI